MFLAVIASVVPGPGAGLAARLPEPPGAGDGAGGGVAFACSILPASQASKSAPVIGVHVEEHQHVARAAQLGALAAERPAGLLVGDVEVEAC